MLLSEYTHPRSLPYQLEVSPLQLGVLFLSVVELSFYLVKEHSIGWIVEVVLSELLSKLFFFLFLLFFQIAFLFFLLLDGDDLELLLNVADFFQLVKVLLLVSLRHDTLDNGALVLPLG